MPMFMSKSITTLVKEVPWRWPSCPHCRVVDPLKWGRQWLTVDEQDNNRHDNASHSNQDLYDAAYNFKPKESIPTTQWQKHQHPQNINRFFFLQTQNINRLLHEKWCMNRIFWPENRSQNDFPIIYWKKQKYVHW